MLLACPGLMLCKKLSFASSLNSLLFRYLFVGIIIIFIIIIIFFLDFTNPAILLLDFQTLLPLKSNIFLMKTIAFFFAGITNLICFIWLVDKFHFLPRCFSFLSCSVRLPVSNVTEYTRFIEWCFRAIPIRRSRLQQVCWNAERLVSLMTDVKALMSSWALQYVSWTTGLKRPDQKTLSRTRTDITWQKIQTEVIALANIKQ